MNDLTTYTPPSARELEQTWLLADRFSRTEFVPAALKGKPEAVMACMLAGRELGIGPMQALQKIHIIQGRPTLSAELMASLVRRAGHRIRTIERSNTTATVEGVRFDDPDAAEKVTWTLDDAKRAKLESKDNWKAYPAAMLWARAVSALCRQLFPDVLAGMSYTPDEISPSDTETTWGEVEVDRETGEVLEESPTGPAVTTTPAGPVATTPSMPTREQTQKLRSIQAAKELVQQADASYQLHVQAAIATLYTIAPKRFWAEAELPAWKHVLEYATALHDHQAYETSAAGHSPPPAADQTSSRGRAERTADGEAAPHPVMTPRLDSPGGGDTP